MSKIDLAKQNRIAGMVVIFFASIAFFCVALFAFVPVENAFKIQNDTSSNYKITVAVEQTYSMPLDLKPSKFYVHQTATLPTKGRSALIGTPDHVGSSVPYERGVCVSFYGPGNTLSSLDMRAAAKHVDYEIKRVGWSWGDNRPSVPHNSHYHLFLLSDLLSAADSYPCTQNFDFVTQPTRTPLQEKIAQSDALAYGLFIFALALGVGGFIGVQKYFGSLSVKK